MFINTTSYNIMGITEHSITLLQNSINMKHHAASCASQIIFSLYWHYAYNMIHHATSCASQSILSNIWHNSYNTLHLTTSCASQSILSHKWQSESSCYIFCITEHLITLLTLCPQQSILSHKWQSESYCNIFPRALFQIFDKMPTTQ